MVSYTYLYIIHITYIQKRELDRRFNFAGTAPPQPLVCNVTASIRRASAFG
ncbi:unnamed protein product [Brassica napus]|uniref:(rape) hypothetical protein n=1 Tax=Brassica napus TaxID=3708 RepID=A0A816YQJ3_BRANA|nr:unnamed protein product [Brassica napus]